MHHSIHHVSGIPVTLTDIPDAHSTTIEILAKAGSIYETRETSGISHFLEHMFFKGGKTYPTPKIVASTIDAFGGEFNAFTGNEYAGYYIKSAPEHLDTSLDVLADMLIHAQFPQEELEREKQVVIQEIMMYEDMPQQKALQNWRRRYYGDNSYGRETLGTVDTVNSFKQADLLAHKSNLYTKDNLVISVAGAIPDEGKLLELIDLKFTSLNEQKNITPPDYPRQRPPEQQHSDNQETQQNHLVLAAPGVTLHDQERYACKILSVMLGGTMSSRLFQEIREKKGLCYYIKADHASRDHDGLFVIRAGIEKERREFGLSSIYEEIADLATGNITEQEHQKALGNVKGQTKLSLESSDDIAHFLAMQYLFTGKLRTIEEIINNYEQVSLDELKTTAKRLTKDNLYAYRIE